MKKLFALWFMALMLVLFAGSGAVAEEDPFLDGIMDPSNPTVDEGSEEDDHPWGGDQSPGAPTNTTPTRPIRLIMTTGVLPIDQFVTFIVYRIALDTVEKEPVISMSSMAPSARKLTLYTDGVKPSRSFSKKRGVTR